MNFIGFYRSSGQIKVDFENFIRNLERNLEHIANISWFLVSVLGDWNARIQGWCQYYIISSEGSKIDMVTCQFSLS